MVNGWHWMSVLLPLTLNPASPPLLLPFLILLITNRLLAHSLPEYPFINCFSCASEDYEAIYQRANSPALFGRPLIFDRLCDSHLELRSSLSPSALVPCDSACLSVIEPQFFGGVQNERRPFTYVRGCASDIFELAMANADSAGVPAEIDYLQRAQACLELPIGQIWPQLGDITSRQELVRVCSCASDECNLHDDLAMFSNGARGGRMQNWLMTIILPFLGLPILMLFVLQRPSIFPTFLPLWR